VRLAQPLDAVFDAVEGGWRPVTEAFRASPAGRALIDFVDGRVRGYLVNSANQRVTPVVEAICRVRS